MSENVHGKAVLDDLRPLARELRHAIPGVYEGFSSMSKSAFSAGDLDAKTKELIALGIAVALRCDGCIASHASGSARAGATTQEAAEAIGVAIVLSGGPGTVYGPRAYDAFCEYAEGRDKLAE